MIVFTFDKLTDHGFVGPEWSWNAIVLKLFCNSIRFNDAYRICCASESQRLET